MTARALAATGLVITVVVAVSTLIIGYPVLEAGARVMLAAVAVAAWLALVGTTIRFELGLRAVLTAGLVLGAVAVAAPSRGSNDLWTYAMYGRTVTEHGASPYRSPPEQFPND